MTTDIVTAVPAMGTENGETPKREPRSIALCAHSMRTRDLAPVNDEQWVIFGLNNLHRFIPKGHLWIQVHSPDYLAAHPAYSKEDVRFYETLQIPLYTTQRWPQWPTSMPIPLDRLRERFPRVSWDSTMLYMVGLAILMIEDGHFPGDLDNVAVPARRFGMWGLDMLDNYAQQGPLVGYLLGAAEAAGIEVVVPQGAGFFRRTWLYGYEDKEIGKRRTQLETRKAEIEQQTNQLQAKRANIAQTLAVLDQRIVALSGAAEENKYQLKNFVPEDDAVAAPETLAAAQRIVLTPQTAEPAKT